MTKDNNPTEEIPTLGEVLKKLMLSFLVGQGVIVVFALQSSSLSQFISVAGMGVLIAVAIFFSGILIGFIFGIPLVLSQNNKSLELSASNVMTTQEGNMYQDNTNLDQISDWLTKILVGIGLTQLVRLPAALQEYSNNIAPSLGGFTNSGTFGVAILLFSSVNGFLVGYLWTRRRLAVEFGKGRYENIQIKHLQDQVSELDERTRIDSKAIWLVKTVLNPLPDMQKISQDELNEKINKASDDAKSKIFFLAKKERENNCLNNKQAVERTIPIFRALIASDVENKYHTSYEQLGLALMYKQNPRVNGDLDEAFDNLDTAIEIRGPWNPKSSTYWLSYECYRAICKIFNDNDYKKGNKTKPEVQEIILGDIKNADKSPKLSKLMNTLESEYNPIPQWMKLNDLNIGEYVHPR